MNHLKLFENSENIILWNFLKEQNRMYELIKNFLMEFKSDLRIIYSNSTIGDFDIKKVIKIKYYIPKYAKKTYPPRMNVWLQDNRDHVELEIELSETDTKELMEFIEDPELYRNSKKYNL